MLALQVPFANPQDLENFCQGEFFPVGLLSSRASSTGIDFVKSLLELPPEYRPSAKDAIGAEWLRVARQEAAPSQADLISGLPSNSSISGFQLYTWVSREITISDRTKGYSVDMPSNLMVPGLSAARAGRSEGASSSPRHDRHQTGSLCVS
jgi:serine/threonine protein kinase